MGSPTPRYLYYVCPKCGALKEVEFFSEANVKELKQLTVYCWDHPAKIECDFVMGSRDRQTENREYLLEMGDVYTPIRMGHWELGEDAEINVNCPKCMRSIDIPEEIITKDGNDGRTDQAVNCGGCDFASPIRIRGLFE